MCLLKFDESRRSAAPAQQSTGQAERVSDRLTQRGPLAAVPPAEVFGRGCQPPAQEAEPRAAGERGDRGRAAEESLPAEFPAEERLPVRSRRGEEAGLSVEQLDRGLRNRR